MNSMHCLIMQQNRKDLEFQIQWTDGDLTWEPWERVRKLEAIDDYIRQNPGNSLKFLLGKN